jgi:hypothetical protein
MSYSCTYISCKTLPKKYTKWRCVYCWATLKTPKEEGAPKKCHCPEIKPIHRTKTMIGSSK